MTLQRIALSLPGSELATCEAPSSVFDARLLRDMQLAPQVKLAIQLLAEHYRPVTCIARPEMFTHGVARQWLANKLQGIDTHIGISDGTAVKLVDGLKNHVFFFGLDIKQNSEALRGLLRWTPEPFTQLHSQINSCHSTQLHGNLITPQPRLLLPSKAIEQCEPQFHHFYFNQLSIDNSAQRIVANVVDSSIEQLELIAFKRITYVGATATALRNKVYVHQLCKEIRRAYFDTACCVLIRLPRVIHGDLQDSITVLLEAMADSGVALPPAMARNVLVMTHDAPEHLLKSLASRLWLLVDESFEFWRYTRALYPALRGVRSVMRRDQANHALQSHALTALFGRAPTVRNGYLAIKPQSRLQCAVA